MTAWLKKRQISGLRAQRVTRHFTVGVVAVHAELVDLLVARIDLRQIIAAQPMRAHGADAFYEDFLRGH